MKRKEIQGDIFKLETAIEAYSKKAEEIHRLRERIGYSEEIYAAKEHAYHVLPITHMDTVYSYYEKELREKTEWISDRRFGARAWTDYWEVEDGIKAKYAKIAAERHGCEVRDGILTKDCKGEDVKGELPIARYFDAMLLCDAVYRSEEGWVLKLSDPYGCFVSQPLTISEQEAKNYVGKILSVVLYTKFKTAYKIEEFKEFLWKSVERNNRIEPIYERYNPIFKEYDGNQYREIEVYDVKITPYTIKGKKGEKERSLSPLLCYVKSFENVGTESEFVKALDSIQAYVAKSDECTFNMRVSPMEYRIILKNRVLYAFFWCNDKFCFSKEENHKFPTEREDRPARGDYILCEKAYDFNFREYANFYYEVNRLRFEVDNIDRLEKGLGKHEVMEWQGYPSNESTKYRFKSKWSLLKIRDRLMKEADRQLLRVQDRWLYARHASLIREDAALHNEDYCRNYSLCEHPEYYEKWRGTFFDRQGGLLYHSLIRGFEEVSTVIKASRQVVWHEYYLKNGAKSPFENLKLFNREWVRRVSWIDIEDDMCVRYIGFCDTVSCVDGNATVHLIDPSGDMYFRNLDIPADVLGKAIGRMCMITCVYNYEEEGKYRLLDFNVMPFTLSERVGEYPADAVIVKHNLVIKGRMETGSFSLR